MAQSLEARLSQTESHPSAMSRSNSSASISDLRLRPKSRGSTASLQSVGVGNSFVPQQQHGIPLEHQPFALQPPPSTQSMFPSRADDSAALLQYQQHMAQMQQAQPLLDHGHVMMQHDMRPVSQHGLHDLPFGMQFPNAMSQYGVPHPHMQHMRHQSEQFEGSPAPEDSSNENGGAKRRKGAASSMANDQELRRLLGQYQGRSLKDVAHEVQKNEGAGGKSEKAKQVFAMLWLQENCRRSTNSVRRDRVFARYTERCGNERVPTLNPASFGKLVRIIFPNVQTRRLGVRGESKYHYVDLSLVPDDEQSATIERPGTAGSIVPQRPGSSADTGRTQTEHVRADSTSNIPEALVLETADFPAPKSTLQTPSELVASQPVLVQEVDKIDCRNLNTPMIRISTAGMPLSLVNSLPALRSNLPATMATYLSMPSDMSLSHPSRSTGETPIELPDIHEYLTGTTYDHHIAKLLQDLYRSYCIDVIDAFRKCKDKSFFNHHSAFNGKMTVPVSKVFTMSCVAPWIQECDMRMYKGIVRFVAPLVQQTVPDVVWQTFDRIGGKLVRHLVLAFEEKCPAHVVAAKVVPAARFTSLLRKLKGANEAAVRLSELFEKEPQSGTQMWLDLLSILDPERLLDDSTPPPECIENVKGFLKHDLRAWTAPIDDPLVMKAEADEQSAFVDFLTTTFDVQGLLTIEDVQLETVHRLIRWLGRLSVTFRGHHPQCMLDWHMRFWRCIMDQVGAAGAQGYRQWYYTESFMTQMLAFMAQMEGFLLDESTQKLHDARELQKKKQAESTDQHVFTKRKRDDNDVGGEDRKPSKANIFDDSSVTASAPASFTEAAKDVNTVEDSDADMDELQRGGPLDLPTFRTGLTSPIKPNNDADREPIVEHNNEDSGIGLSLDEHDPDTLEAEKEARKFNKRDWLLSSDPVEPGMTNIGVLV